MPFRYPARASEAYDYRLTIARLLDDAAKRPASTRIIYRNEVELTYGELRERIGRLASALDRLGVTSGTTVAVMDWDSHRYLEAYFAVPMMGAVLQTANVRLSPEQLLYTLQHARAEVILVHRDFVPLIDAIRDQLGQLRAVIIIADGQAYDVDGVAGEYEQLLADAVPSFVFPDVDENAVATTFYTTGTTGNPKGVEFTHRQLVLHTLACTGPHGSTSKVSALAYDDVYMPLTPMFHVHAWGMPYVATLLGVTQVYPGRYEPQLICALRQQHGVTFSHGVPTVLRMVLEAAGEIDLTGWKMIIGGSALPKSLFEAATARGMQLSVGYGMSETCPIIALARPTEGGMDLADCLTAAGAPVPLASARIVDEQMNELPWDGASRGELLLRAPWLTQSYTGDAQASEALWRGGWLHTQDVATIDPDGTVRIRDRLKDVVKTGGEWIDSIQLEELLMGSPQVSEAAVVAVPDERWGERPLAVVVPSAGATISLKVLNREVERSIAQGSITRYALLDRFELIEALPRTSVGKIDKKVLRQRFGTAL